MLIALEPEEFALRKLPMLYRMTANGLGVELAQFVSTVLADYATQRAAAAGIKTRIGNHTFRATDITLLEV